MDWLYNLTNSEALLTYGGFAAILIVIFAETGLLIGFFLPGDYFLFLAGVFCGSGKLNIGYIPLLIGVFLAAVIGNFTGYLLGKYIGDKLFKREDSFFFKKSYLDRTKNFYDKYGARALVLGRFLPIIRTFVPVFAGAVHLDIKRFTLYNLVGGALWVGLLISLGYYFGKEFPEIIKYAIYIILGFIIITTFPLINTLRKVKNMKVIKRKD
ncbi:MAG: DedA family protein [Bacteroidetes bacterium]|nr:DedA family protein [Bacteroidota bacterium]